MDIRSLELFLHLSKSLHFGKTSQEMHISPSALTRSIQQLEEKLSTVLFERDNRSVTLTPAGQKFSQYALKTLENWRILNNDLLEEKQELQGEISIYCSVTASYSFLHNTLSNFRQQHPKIRIVLHTGDAENAIQYILLNQEDIAIGAKPDKYPENLAFKRIASTPLVMIASRQEDIYKLDWRQAALILPEKGFIRNKADRWLESLKVTPKIYAQVSGNEAVVSMVSLGYGYGILPKIVLDNSPLANSVNIITLDNELPKIDVGFFVQNKNLQNPIIQAAWRSLST